MNNNMVLLAGALILGFSITASVYSVFSKKDPNDKTFLPIYFVFAVGSLAMFFINPNNLDSLNPISFEDLLAALIAPGIIYLVSTIDKIKKFSFIAILAASIAVTALLPQEFLLFEGNVPFIVDRAIIALSVFLFSYCYKYLNGVDGIVGIQSITISSGVLIFFLFGALPFLTASIGSLLIGCTFALGIYSWFPSRINLRNEDCYSIGFILAWLLLKVSQEGLATCALILSVYYLCEILWASIKAALPFGQNKDITTNTIYAEANLTGLSPIDVGASISKVQLFVVVLATLQLYSPNLISLPIFAFLSTAWFLSKLKNWYDPVKSIREINKDVLEDIKDGFKNISNRNESDK